jgi:hypothetical protein
VSLVPAGSVATSIAISIAVATIAAAVAYTVERIEWPAQTEEGAHIEIGEAEVEGQL